VWDELYLVEQARILRLLVERIDVVPDGVSVTLHAAGIRSLVAELAGQRAFASAASEPLLKTRMIAGVTGALFARPAFEYRCSRQVASAPVKPLHSPMSRSLRDLLHGRTGSILDEEHQARSTGYGTGREIAFWDDFGRAPDCRPLS
jgi:hypothetical protein